MRPNAKFWSMRLLLAAALLLVAAKPAQAYILENVAWSAGTPTSPHSVPMQLELQTTGPANKPLMDGKTTWDQVAVEAFSIWNQYLVTMQFNGIVGSTAAVVATNSNGLNTVSFRSTDFDEAWPTGVVGLTYYYYTSSSTASIKPTTETDVIFNSNVTWDSYRGAQIPGSIDLRRIAIHEFGHALGLNHPDTAGQVVVAIMNSTASAIDTLTPDDIAGGQFLYNLAPSIVTQPSSQTAPPGGSVTFMVSTTAQDGAATYQWQYNNANIAGETGSSLTLSNLSVANNQGNYRVIIADRAGSTTSNVATLTVVAGPSITTNPISQTLTNGSALTLSVAASGSSNLTYQWYLNGTAIAGATSSTYSVNPAGATDAGSYTVVVANGGATNTSSAATVVINTTARLINLSTIANTGSAGLTAGFVIGGTGNKNVLIRGVGPALAPPPFSVPNTLTNPVLTLNTTPAVSNSGWGGSQLLVNAFASVGAFPLSAGSADSALLASLAGSQTATVLGAGGVSGNALLEVYDRDAITATARLINLSVNDFITAPGTLTAGFTINGTGSLTLLIRAVGPSLSVFGEPNLLAVPILTIVPSGSTTAVASNSGWSNDAKLAAVALQVQAFALQANSADSALLVTLPAGGYSAVVSSGTGASGNALVELYEVR